MEEKNDFENKCRHLVPLQFRNAWVWEFKRNHCQLGILLQERNSKSTILLFNNAPVSGRYNPSSSMATF